MIVIHYVHKETLVYYDPTHIQGIRVTVVSLSLILKAEIQNMILQYLPFEKNRCLISRSRVLVQPKLIVIEK